jgi:hypothetical protein
MIFQSGPLALIRHCFHLEILGNRLMVGQTILAQAIDLTAARFPSVPNQLLKPLEFFRSWKTILMMRSMSIFSPSKLVGKINIRRFKSCFPV